MKHFVVIKDLLDMIVVNVQDEQIYDNNDILTIIILVSTHINMKIIEYLLWPLYCIGYTYVIITL